MLETVSYFCKIDQSMQPAIVRRAAERAPLLLALHTWSYTHQQDCSEFSGFCEKHNWNMIFPEFRGPNDHPEACGSDFVVSDLEDAVAYMKQTADVDPERVYLVGGSGGGHCALLMAGRRPDLWSAVSSWCPIYDLAAWYAKCKGRFGYAEHVEKACGGNPFTSEEAAVQARLRSPAAWLPNALHLNIEIGAGIHDWHKGTVPVSQAISAYNALALPEDRISEEDIRHITDQEEIPAHLKTTEDPAFGKHTPLLRKCSHRVRLTIFEGAHDLLGYPAMEWLARQKSGRQPDWSAGVANPEEEKYTELGK